ncbi:MAG: porin family protein [Endomicrobium sp.]|jgi:opacity protein-like surface antigen|nr:porin family protein [Endomicrobium sp.]
MKKLILAAFCAAFLSSAAFADSDSSTVYISGSLSQSFSDFSYDSFIDDFLNRESNSEKAMDGPRYDFSAGYRLGSKLRAEAQYIIISANSFSTDKNNSDIKYKANAVFANLIYDFWDIQNNLITPFIGAGIGLGSPNLKLSIADLQKEREDNGFSWQVQAGVSVKLLKWLLVNIKYSYLSIPGIENSFETGNANTEHVESEFKKGVQSAGIGVTLLL